MPCKGSNSSRGEFLLAAEDAAAVRCHSCLCPTWNAERLGKNGQGYWRGVEHVVKLLGGRNCTDQAHLPMARRWMCTCSTAVCWSSLARMPSMWSATRAASSSASPTAPSSCCPGRARSGSGGPPLQCLFLLGSICIVQDNHCWKLQKLMKTCAHIATLSDTACCVEACSRPPIGCSKTCRCDVTSRACCSRGQYYCQSVVSWLRRRAAPRLHEAWVSGVGFRGLRRVLPGPAMTWRMWCAAARPHQAVCGHARGRRSAAHGAGPAGGAGQAQQQRRAALGEPQKGVCSPLERFRHAGRSLCTM